MRALIPLLALLSGSAQAATTEAFYPLDTSWSVSSSMVIANGGFQGYTCPATMSFNTTGVGTIKVTAMSVNGCQGVVFTGLPWTMTPNGTEGHSTHLAWTYTGGSCSGKLVFIPQSTRVVYDTQDGRGCDISGVFTTSPLLTIGPK